ncbi:MAG: methylenetetrahydrofolate--tRNA-(uracil(54)-C(5))-methyltransferase (FADH(2)-oxidizing) TrmFO [Desulfovibrio sp.]|jgi:methylenetetrahydrofolate--tRNA-(uracil-5-)-methyltransferase|nr:methylenetetrahydrofolate--tRNA-(uracil(54)-C(5))-methyltransferase (FADH(2)-oxidizing) TrmFO [Desulfovibrio sp.]
MPSAAVIGAGLAGCECAFALAQAGVRVTVFEMKPQRFSPAHTSPDCAELVCSNSFRSSAPDCAIGVLHEEMRALGSLCLAVAETCKVPAGRALAVDRKLFSGEMTRRVLETPNITMVRREILSLGAKGDPPPDPELAGHEFIVVSAGPLAGESLSASLGRLAGEEHLYFYDAIAPVLDGFSVNTDRVFAGNRHDPGNSDYLNCPLDKEGYTAFREALLGAERVPPRPFEKETHFEGCMPVETLAERGFMTLAFGPLKPVGLIDPRTGTRPFAALQLRAEDLNRSMFNLVGCQTKLRQSEQERVFGLIPGLEKARFVRFGSMHRNTFVNAPRALSPDLSLRARADVFLAGQLTGVEGYAESAACGLWLGKRLAARIKGKDISPPPPETALGALLMHLQSGAGHFQPSNVQFGLMPELGRKAGFRQRRALYAERARASFRAWLEESENNFLVDI